jgi:hypothetical protein
MTDLNNYEIFNLALTISKEINTLDGIKCNEPVDFDCLINILKSDLLNSNPKWNERKLITKYKSLINRENNTAKVEYKRVAGMSWGRSNPKNHLGMFLMRKEIRHTLALRAGFSDWDIENAHPVLLYQICKANSLSCNHLEYYCNNRDEILGKLMKLTKCNRGRAKLLFITLLYGSKIESWLKEDKTDEGVIINPEISLYAFENDDGLFDWIEKLTAELEGIGKHIVKNNPMLVKEIKKNKILKQEKNYTLSNTLVSFFLQECECRILEQIYMWCIENNYIKDNVCVLCADGIMLQDKLLKDGDFPLNEKGDKTFPAMEVMIKETTGFDVKITNKSLNEGWTDEFIKEHLITESSLDELKLDKFDTEYFNTLKGYDQKKIYFETFVAKILRPDPVYVYIEQETDVGEDLCFYTENKIINTFNHLKSGVFNDKGEEKKFVTVWIGDETIRLYNKMDFLPYNDKQPIPKHIFNLFRGFNPNKDAEYDYSKKDKILKPFLDLGLELCGGDKTHFDYLMKYIADIIQNPQIKNPIAFIIKGKHGTGKNVWLYAVGLILGIQHYISSSNPKDFFGEYAEGFYHKLLVNMNECEGKDTFDFEGRIKSFITEDKITLNRKFVQPITIMNLARLIIFTNKTNPIPIDIRSKDRRYVVYDTTDKYLSTKYGTDFWKSLINHFKKPEFISCLYDYLNDMDIDGFDWKNKRPITKAYLQMCKLYVPAEILFLENKLVGCMNSDAGISELMKISHADDEFEDVEIDGNTNYENSFKNEGILGQDLYKEYVSYCREWGFFKDASYQKNLKSFYSKLTEFELPIQMKKEHNTIKYYFSIKEVLDYMKAKKWIDRSDDDYNVETETEVKGDNFDDYFNF